MRLIVSSVTERAWHSTVEQGQWFLVHSLFILAPALLNLLHLKLVNSSFVEQAATREHTLMEYSLGRHCAMLCCLATTTATRQAADLYQQRMQPPWSPLAVS